MTSEKLKKLELSSDMYTSQEIDNGLFSSARYELNPISVDADLSCKLKDNAINYISTSETGNVSAYVPDNTGRCRDTVAVVDKNVKGFSLIFGNGVTTYIDDEFTASDMTFVTETTTAYSMTELKDNVILLGKKTLRQVDSSSMF